ncbi:MAG: alpha/beta hydrolase [Clostridia bacterium]|nr:alpha/beta hydrolase [Clostridia bacterium]
MIKTAKINDIEMDYAVFGNGEKPFVIIPGLSIKSVLLSESAVEHAYSRFKKDYTVYVIDRRKAVPEDYTITRLADDTALVMRSLGIENACLFGASQGALTSICIAGRHPELVGKLAVGSAVLRETESFSETLKTWTALAKAGDTQALARSMAKLVFSEKIYERVGDTFVKLNSGLTSEELDRFIALASAKVGESVAESAAKIICPALVIGSEGDVITGGEAAKELAQAIDGAELYIYGKEYGHAVYDEAPDYKERLLEFFGK